MNGWINKRVNALTDVCDNDLPSKPRAMCKEIQTIGSLLAVITQSHVKPTVDDMSPHSLRG